MPSFIIEGGHRLKGNITPQGAKNEALQVLSAALLTDAPVILHNLPDILDINNQIRLLQDVGVSIQRTSPHDIILQANAVDTQYLQSDEFLQRCGKLRGSVMLMGPLLARFGQAMIARPGGDNIGRRRLDTHFLGLEKLGGKILYDSQRQVFSISAKKLQGTYMLLDEASITGTANILMAAVLAEGTTTIYNAACEPYIQQLCHMLVSMGARIQGAGSGLLAR